jgi:hypothetical protein
MYSMWQLWTILKLEHARFLKYCISNSYPSMKIHRTESASIQLFSICSQAGWPDEFVKKSPKNVAQPFFVKISAWT